MPLPSTWLLISNKSKYVMTLWEYHAVALSYLFFQCERRDLIVRESIIDVDRTKSECQASIVLSGTTPIAILVLCWIPS